MQFTEHDQIARILTLADVPSTIPGALLLVCLVAIRLKPDLAVAHSR